ncbi:MAG: hypothetical protein WAL51_12395 [Candidatus Acidiferrales bacterium]
MTTPQVRYSFRRWFLATILGVLGVYAGVVVVLCGFLRLSFQSTIRPGAATCAVTAALIPSIYWSQRYRDLRNGDVRLLVATLGAYMLAVTLIVIHYAAVLRFMSARAAFGTSLIVAVIFSLATGLSVLRRSPSRPKD